MKIKFKIFLPLFFFFSCNAEKKVESSFPELAINQKIGNISWKLVREIKKENFDNKVFEGGGKRIEILAIDSTREDGVAQLLEGKDLQMKKMFESSPLPYGGVISREQGCLSANTFHEVPTTEEQKIYYYNLEASERYVYGLCEKNSPYVSQYILLWCRKNKKIFEVKFFTSMKDKQNFNFSNPLIYCKI